MQRPSFKSFLKADSGIAAIEMAFILPFMAVLFFGLIDLTDMISLNRKVTSVASATADLVGQNRNSVLKTDINDYFKVAGLIMRPTPDSEVKVRVSGYRMVGSTITRMWVVDNGKGNGCATSPSTADMASLMVAGNDLIVAQACMHHEPKIVSMLTYKSQPGNTKIVGSSAFDIEQIITLRPRSSLTLNCFMTTEGGTACPTS